MRRSRKRKRLWIRLLRRPADGQRHAPPRPLPDAGDQRPLPALPHDARLPLRTQSRLGHARPARRSRSLQRARHPLQRRNRSLRHRAVHPEMPTKRLALHAGVGTADRAASASGSTSKTPTSPTTKATSKASGGRSKNLFDRGLLYQGHKIVWWWAQGGTALSSRRSRPRLSRGGRSERVCEVSAGSTTGKTDRTSLACLDDDALDAAEQSVCGGAIRLGILVVATMRRAKEADHRRGTWSKRSPEKTKRNCRSIKQIEGKDRLIGRRYRPPFDYYYKHGPAIKSGH